MCAQTELCVEGGSYTGGGNAGDETRKYTSCLQRVIIMTEQAPEKIRAERLRRRRPVPETDTGGRVENTEALERFTVKELGKLTP